MREKLEEFLFGKSKNGEGEQSEHPETATGDAERNVQKQSAESDLNQSPAAQTAPLAADALESEPQLPRDTDKLPPLSPEAAARPTAEPRLDVASRCHIGAVRQRNEDACYTFVAKAGGGDALPQFGLFIVADGMGGHFEGHTASKTVSRIVARQVLDKLYRPMLEQAGTAMQQPVQEVLQEAVAEANEAISNPDPDKLMGTTLTAALILGGRLFLVHVGDSRAYLMQEGDLTPITTDHSVVRAMQDSGQISASEAAHHPNRNLLYRALMGEQLEQIDAFTRTLPARGQLLLCSDGLWGLVPDAQMAAILSQDASLQQMADQLLEAALAAGGSDNITVILVDFTR